MVHHSYKKEYKYDVKNSFIIHDILSTHFCTVAHNQKDPELVYNLTDDFTI